MQRRLPKGSRLCVNSLYMRRVRRCQSRIACTSEYGEGEKLPLRFQLQKVHKTKKQRPDITKSGLCFERKNAKEKNIFVCIYNSTNWLKNQDLFIFLPRAKMFLRQIYGGTPMENGLSIINIAPHGSEKGITLCQETLLKYGIILSEKELAALGAAQARALRDSGRVEFGVGVLPSLARAFANSPYITRENCAELLEELQSAFYFFRSECDGLISDEKLIAFMKKEFNGAAGGDIGYLTGTSLERLCARLKGKDSSWI